MTFAPPTTKAFYLEPQIIFPEDFKLFQQRLRDVYYNIATCVNGREISFYPLVETVCGQYYFTSGNPQKFRTTFRKTFILPATAAGATTTIPHGIDSFTEMMTIKGDAITVVVDYRPIPYVDPTDVKKSIGIRTDSTNIYIVNGAAAPNISSGTITCEYVKTV
jgi:hypothetical protein